jgi:hypothetical protein
LLDLLGTWLCRNVLPLLVFLAIAEGMLRDICDGLAFKRLEAKIEQGRCKLMWSKDMYRSRLQCSDFLQGHLCSNTYAWNVMMLQCMYYILCSFLPILCCRNTQEHPQLVRHAGHRSLPASSGWWPVFNHPLHPHASECPTSAALGPWVVHDPWLDSGKAAHINGW